VSTLHSTPNLNFLTFPKGTDFTKISNENVLKVEKLLNDRPRKRLNCCTPRKVFNGKDFKKFSYLFN
jgi:IS30 family transposase